MKLGYLDIGNNLYGKNILLSLLFVNTIEHSQTRFVFAHLINEPNFVFKLCSFSYTNELS